MTKTQSKNLLCSYDESDVYTNQVEYLMESEDITEEEAKARTDDDDEIYNFEWDIVKEELATYMGNNIYWRAEGRSMGWRNLSGHKVFQADTAEELLRAVLPDTAVTLTVWKHYNGLKMKVSHHDSPMGEHYIIKPITEKEYDRD